MEQLEGLGVALATPFKANSIIDYEALLLLLKHTCSEADYWVVMGSTGEAITLSNKEQEEVLSFVRANNPQDLPIVFGLGGSNTAELVDRVQEINLSGVSAILSSSPAYNKPTQAGIIAHFTKLANSSPLPIILYNVPGRTCSNIDASTTLTLAKHPNIIAIKEASADLEQVAEIIKGAPQDFILTSGDDMLTPAIIKLGGKGAISVLGNALPKEFNQVVKTALKGAIEESQQYANRLQGISDLMYVEGNPAGLKELLAQQGICHNVVRLPLVSATDKLKQSIKIAREQL